MTCTKRVAAKDGIGLNTAIEDASVYVSSTDPLSLADAILRLLFGGRLRTKLGNDAAMSLRNDCASGIETSKISR